MLSLISIHDMTWQWLHSKMTKSNRGFNQLFHFSVLFGASELFGSKDEEEKRLNPKNFILFLTTHTKRRSEYLTGKRKKRYMKISHTVSHNRYLIKIRNHEMKKEKAVSWLFFRLHPWEELKWLQQQLKSEKRKTNKLTCFIVLFFVSYCIIVLMLHFIRCFIQIVFVSNQQLICVSRNFVGINLLSEWVHKSGRLRKRFCLGVSPKSKFCDEMNEYSEEWICV